MYKLEFTLKQHTPIIHFQHDQDGATLRATEVKPKLDRFILMKLGKEAAPDETDEQEIYKKGRDEAQKKGWLIDDDKGALDYKLSIKAPINEKPSFFYFETRIKKEHVDEVKDQLLFKLKLPNLEICTPTPFFANNDKRNNNEFSKMVLGVFWQGLHDLKIISTNEKLIDCLSMNLTDFFCYQNFGMRQSKGYGCFLDANLDDNDFLKIIKQNFDFYHKISLSVSNITDIFKKIDTVYKSIKNKPPNESKLRDYFNDLGIEWEKELVSKTIAQMKSYSPVKDVKYVRALLGLAELYDYQQLGVKVKIKHNSDESNTISRFRSPILFKVKHKDIYLLANNRDVTPILGKDFIFYIGDNPEAANRRVIISTPATFVISEFLKTIF